MQDKLVAEAEDQNWDTPLYYGDGPAGEATQVAHTTTLGERIGRNACDSENCTFFGNMALVTIYGFWEDHYREKIAETRGIAKDDIKSDVMGDIRHLRHSIIHNIGIATKEVENCKVLKWFNEGDKVFLNEQMFLQMISHVRADLHELRSNPSCMMDTTMFDEEIESGLTEISDVLTNASTCFDVWREMQDGPKRALYEPVVEAYPIFFETTVIAHLIAMSTLLYPNVA